MQALKSTSDEAGYRKLIPLPGVNFRRCAVPACGRSPRWTGGSFWWRARSSSLDPVAHWERGRGAALCAWNLRSTLN